MRENKGRPKLCATCAIYNYLGEELATTQEGEVGFIEYQLTKSDLYKTREKLNFLNDRDQFEIKL